MESTSLSQIFTAIDNNGFLPHTLQLIDNYTDDILYGRTNLSQFNLSEHAGVCSAGAPLIGAYLVCDYARTSLTSSTDVATSQGCVPNWEIDAKQEKLVQQWAEARHLWVPNSEQMLTEKYGPLLTSSHYFYQKHNALIYNTLYHCITRFWVTQ